MRRKDCHRRTGALYHGGGFVMFSRWETYGMKRPIESVQETIARGILGTLQHSKKAGRAR